MMFQDVNNKGTMIEKGGTSLDETEVKHLADMLKTLRYCPRIEYI